MLPETRCRLWPGAKAAIRGACMLLMMLPLVGSVGADMFPYIPTTILAPPTDSSLTTVYVFREKDEKVEFLSLDTGSTVGNDKEWKTLSKELPFLKGKSPTTTFAPTITHNGTVVVYAGDCSSSNQFGIWTYAPGDADGEGSWRQLSTQASDSAIKQPGPSFLGGAINFSAQLEPTVSEPLVYSFGGMCSIPAAEVEEWQSKGNYSNQMLRVSPSGSQYVVETVSAKGPVREAGFTLTGLLPSISQRADTVTQRNSYVLLGGHTQGAFINMSTAAIWNLPEETWSFAAIKSDEMGSGELKKAAARAENSPVHSRSGHSTILSQDGTSLVILGGWVGTVNTPSEPQLAILKMGETYDEWEWEVPDAQPSWPGLYGHGAAMLPGNVMMVYGGYGISESPSKVKRQSDNTAQFLNLTSMSWSSSYTNPDHSRPGGGVGGGGSDESTGNDAEGSSKSNKTKIGVGVGLGVGLGLIAAALLGLFCFKKNGNRRKRNREEAIRALAQDTSHFLPGEGEMMERDEFAAGFPWPGQSWYTGGHDPYQNGVRSLGYESLRGSRGSHFRSPGCLQIPRKPVARARGLYQPAGMPGRIHPIYEDDEGDAEPARDTITPSPSDSVGPQTPTSQVPSDPFATPVTMSAPALLPTTRQAATPSPEGPHQDPEVQDWMSDVDVAETLLTRMDRRRSGRVSPTRRNSIRSQTASYAAEDDGRTASNLSESTRSNISISRSMSTRSRPRSGGFNSSMGATTLLGASTVTDGRLGSSSSSSPSYNTAKTSFPALQAEGPSLLLGRQDDEDDIPVPGSPSKSKPRRGWLGSLRRVFNPTPTSSQGSDVSSRAESPDRPSLDRVSSDYEHRLMGLSGIGGGSLLRRKQGKQGWEEVPSTAAEEPRKSGDTDWDIERAVEQRLVQVMFTVPKEKLRVVNAEIDKEEEVVLVNPSDESSQGSMSSRTGKGKGVDSGVMGARELMSEKDGDDVFAPKDDQPPHGEKTAEESAKSRPAEGMLEIHDDVSQMGSDILHTAEEIRMERPRTRVLEMVESIEGRSRDSSPAV